MSTKVIMAKKRSNPERDRVEFLAEPEWIERVIRHAERLGLSISSYIRMVVTMRMDEEEAARPLEEKNKRK